MFTIKIIFTDGTDFKIKEDLISFNALEHSKDSNLSPTPGIIEQGATIVFFDRKKAFKDLCKRKTVNFFRLATVYIHYFDSTTNDTTFIGDYLIDSVSMESDDNTVTINCTDQSYMLSLATLPRQPVANRTVHALLRVVFENSLPNATWGYFSQSDRASCSAIMVSNSYFVETNARKALENVCKVGMLNVFYSRGKFYVRSCL